MRRFELAVVGAGPAGLAAAIEAGSAGVRTVVIDENLKPGGQLFKQIHKFFGSSEHQAGTRGFEIGRRMLSTLSDTGVEVWLDSQVYGLFPGWTLAVNRGDRHEKVQADRVLLATGASENSIPFPGWTLPGVMGAGAAQTMINVHRVLPGSDVVMVGSGNVGLIVSYQLLQAGANVVAVVEAAPKIGGYGVHASKLRRAGVPIYRSHTVLRATGPGRVAEVTIGMLDESWRPVSGSERTFRADTICLAVGLTPLAELAWMAGCEFIHNSRLGGFIPVHNREMETTTAGLFVAGDITGVEEASSAMEEGRLAGLAAASSLGRIGRAEAESRMQRVWDRLCQLREGPFGVHRRQAKDDILRKFEVRAGDCATSEKPAAGKECAG
ncbi:MAG: FAD-dependent oxidoreductase [Firmicutes bacterium]|nr:FAD-dependent oxidoreductase [Bacillota bacterium]